ncbi:MAG: nitronate monooxygenase [Myxococcales bacterium]|nr:nitronate monooxygenase [Myxococcales bacterium]HIK85327.1 nitronate monooxygenase [Myxococcales bacterium]
MDGLRTRVTQRLGCRYPILQTGMGWVATPRLVAAACNAGAFGFLAAATLPPSDVEEAVLEVKGLTDRPFGVNFLMDAPGAEVISESIIRQNVRAAGYNRAPNADLIKHLKNNDVVCVPTCGAVAHAVKAEKLGADIIIVQGSEGGGHTGNVPTSLLATASADAVDVPIVAAGGFRDGRGLVAALAFGAEGIAMGTRFLMTQESPVPDSTLARFLDANTSDIIVSRALDGLPQRMIQNELTRVLEGSGAMRRLAMALRNAIALRRETGVSVIDLVRSALSMRKNEKLSNAQMILAANAPILARIAMSDGDPAHGYLPSGTVAGLLDDRPTCETLVRRIVEEATNTLNRLRP